MLKLFQGLSRWLANYTSIFVIGVAVFTFFFPHTFDWVRGTTQTVILGIIMLTMGLTLTKAEGKVAIPFEVAKPRVFNDIMEQREQTFLKDHFEKQKVKADIKVLR